MATVVPGGAYQGSLTGVADQNGVALDNTTGVGTWIATTKDGHGTTVASGGLAYVSAGVWHALVYGQYVTRANMPLRMHAQVTDISAATIRAQQDWSLTPAVEVAQSVAGGQPYRVRITGATWLSVLQTNLTCTGTAVTAFFDGTAPNVSTNWGTVLDTGTLLYAGTPGSFQYDVPAAALGAGGRYRVSAVLSDLGGNAILAYEWIVTASR